MMTWVPLREGESFLELRLPVQDWRGRTTERSFLTRLPIYAPTSIGAIFVAMCWLAPAITLAALAVRGIYWRGPQPGHFLILSVAALIAWPAFRMLRQFLTLRPTVCVDSEGLIDFRKSPERIAFSDVEGYRAHYTTKTRILTRISLKLKGHSKPFKIRLNLVSRQEMVGPAILHLLDQRGIPKETGFDFSIAQLVPLLD